MKDHIVTAFDTELKSLAHSIEEMGTLARQSTTIAIAALGQRSPDLARQVGTLERQIDALQREIEESGILVIARRQPVAFDLREVVCALRISNDLERIGDLANNIAKRVVALGDVPVPHPLISGLEGLSALVVERLEEVLSAFDAHDPDKAVAIWTSDDAVDDLYTSVFRGVLTYMMEDPRNITACTQLVFVAKNLERIGDHVSNIAESVHYAATGALLDEPQPDRRDAIGEPEVVAG
ncbi:phosphate signaling complex protein PhoU [Phreatobacter stygius]|uniref:Phosphate-specific transport system accessory protein PhoU n=1 Tax=Phreatobacter stygius TaxID=1940610 RepID=A0A4D7BCC4_9HYPH|nr:phosphate signaling complex protein PhoU [Phreatobacter stygius]QCI68355.1 phosphate signaling complex protein PhoU [Phreatobacter stygius]